MFERFTERTRKVVVLTQEETGAPKDSESAKLDITSSTFCPFFQEFFKSCNPLGLFARTCGRCGPLGTALQKGVAS